MESFSPTGVLSGALLSIAVAAFFVARTLRAWMRLRHIKGPPLAGFTNLWLVRVIMGGNTHWELGDANEKYGEFKIMPVVLGLFRDNTISIKRRSTPPIHSYACD